MTEGNVQTVNHQTTPEKKESTQVRHLLYFFELLNQALEIKMDSVFLVPEFLHQTVSRMKGRSAVEGMTASGEHIVDHVRTLSKIITDLGGRIEQDLLPPKTESREAVVALTFQEGLAAQILEEGLAVLRRDWQYSALTSWVGEQLSAIIAQTQEHARLFEASFASVQPRYRDILLERFRVTALP